MKVPTLWIPLGTTHNLRDEPYHVPHTSLLLYSDDSFSPMDGEPHSMSSGDLLNGDNSMTLQEVMDSDSISKLSSSASTTPSATGAEGMMDVAAGAAKTSIFSQALKKVKQMWDESDMDPAGNPEHASGLDGSSGVFNNSAFENSSRQTLTFVGKTQMYVLLPSCLLIL